jgi:ribosomal protein S18 acetylase RimI-like enzyme
VTVSIRPYEADDADQVRAFFMAVPERDRAFFKEDVADPLVIAQRVAGDGVVRLAVDGDDVVAFASLSPGVARASHVADLRLVVADSARRQGLGQRLAQELLIEALRHEFLKVTVDVAADNQPAIDMFRRLGFEPEGLLRGQLRDGRGQLRDVVALAHLVEDQMTAMALAGIAEELS